ncbi:NADP-dependent oxidoreductase [Kitasatospora camelliae]|uniref:NADP-dependent oxidoreductase n=1 Tax=Kitasatospora camelliae TaxID=3156397 RepID=A0AAU8JZ36_9ACTN
MRAVTQQSFGEPDVLTVGEVARPEPLITEVLVKVRAAGVNPVDAYVRAGAFPLLGEPPFVLGWDVSGVVEQVGAGVNRFAVGDEVYGMPFFPRAAGGYGEYVAAPSRHFARKPKGLDHAQAAALPLAGLTAWQALVDAARLQPGQRVLIHGGAGGVGHLAVQIAKALGAEVYATASAAKHEFVRELGADHLIDYTAGDFAEGLTDLDAVFDTVGSGTGLRSLPVLRDGGVLATITEHFDEELAARVTADGKRYAGVVVEPDHVGLEALTDLVETGRLKPFVEHVLPLEEAAQAHRLIESRRTKGKIVLAL